MKRLLTPAAMEARLREIANKRNARTPERTQAGQEAHGSWSGSSQETKKPGSELVIANQESNDSLSGNSSEILTSSPETAILLDRYGDIMGVVDNHPAFKRAIQQWEVFPQALTEACKRHGLDVVLDAIRYTANYPAAKHKGRFLFAVLKNGKKPKR